MLTQVVNEYFSLGYRLVPFRINSAKEKRPLVEWQRWQTQPQTKEEFDALPWIHANGFAIICGVQLYNGLYVGAIDYDVKNVSDEAREKGREILKAFPVTQMEKTMSQGTHLIYFCRNKPKTVSAYHDVCALELIGEGKLCIMAPSEGYMRLNDNTPTVITDLNELFNAKLAENGIRIKSNESIWFNREDLQEKKYRGEDPPCISAMFKGTTQGLRNEFGIRLASYYLNFKQLHPKRVLALLEDYDRLNSPSLGRRELEAILKSAGNGKYVYGCSDPILSRFCNRENCRLRPRDAREALSAEQKQQAQQILSGNLFEQVLKFGRQRLLGEDNVLIQNFVNIVSGQTKYPISSIIEGYSGSGKNESIRAIKPLIPEEWLFEFTASTPEAMKYIPEEFSGTLIIYEAAALRSETSTLSLRAVGEGESIETIYPVRDEETGKMRLERAKTNAKNFITTDSGIEVFADLYRRVLKVSMNHSIWLTKRVIAKKIRDSQLPHSLMVKLGLATEAVDCEAFRNALRLLNLKAEAILFAPFNLMSMLDLAITVEQKVALRTHIEKLLNFMKVVALLNQTRRVRIKFEDDGSEYVVVDPEDVFFSLEILGDTIISTITRLGKRQNEVLELFEKHDVLDKHMVASELSISEVSAYKTLKSLCRLGYVQEDQSQKLHVYRLQNKPNKLVILQKKSEYCAFFLKELEKFLNTSCRPRQGCVVNVPENYFLKLEMTRRHDASEPELTANGEKKPKELVSSGKTSENKLEINKVKELLMLKTNFSVCECANCGEKKQAYSQINMFDGSWGLLCSECTEKLYKQLTRNEN